MLECFGQNYIPEKIIKSYIAAVLLSTLCCGFILDTEEKNYLW